MAEEQRWRTPEFPVETMFKQYHVSGSEAVLFLLAELNETNKS